MDLLNPGLLADAEAIKELYFLWSPVYPFLAGHFTEIYGRKDGMVIEMGPFCGTVFAMVKEGIGDSFLIATFPPGLAEFFREEAKKHGRGKVNIIESTPFLADVPKNGFDLAVFRGALFFPVLFEVDFAAIDRILRPGGIAVIGGGFGKFTPKAVVEKIAKQSRSLNLRLGKKEVDRGILEKNLKKIALGAKAKVSSEGGLWVILKKEPSSSSPEGGLFHTDTFNF
jgi:hypothetical protein